jgi:hypothetical protein
VRAADGQQRPLHGHGRGDPLDLVGRRQGGQNGVVDLGRPRLAAAVVVDDDAARHRHEPRAKRGPGLGVQLVGVAPGADEGLLDHVLSPVPIATGKPEREGHQRSAVLVVQ